MDDEDPLVSRDQTNSAMSRNQEFIFIWVVSLHHIRIDCSVWFGQLGSWFIH